MFFPLPNNFILNLCELHKPESHSFNGLEFTFHRKIPSSVYSTQTSMSVYEIFSLNRKPLQ